MIRNLKAFVSNRHFLSIGLVFSINSILFSFWVTRLPYVKDKLMFSESVLGLALFFIPLGALSAMLLTGFFIRKYGAGKVTFFTTIIFVIAMMFPVSMNSFVWLSVSLFFVGVGSGSMDVAMNAVAATMESRFKTVIMSTCHGFFSLGLMVGALVGSGLIKLGADPSFQMIGGSVFCFFLLLVLRPYFIDFQDDSEDNSPSFSLPGKQVMGMALLGFCIMLGEGGIADWSAIYLEELTVKGAAIAGLGFAGFSLSMTLGRFYGDYIIDRYGAIPVVRWGSALAVAGGLLVVSGLLWAAIPGFIIMGLGYSCIVPVLFSSAAQVKGVSPSQGIASVTTSGFTGFLVGPVLIGFIAEYVSLRAGFGFLVILATIALIFSSRALSFDRRS